MRLSITAMAASPDVVPGGMEWHGATHARAAIVDSDGSVQAMRWLRELGINDVRQLPIDEIFAAAAQHDAVVIGACTAESFALLSVTRRTDVEAFAVLTEGHPSEPDFRPEPPVDGAAGEFGAIILGALAIHTRVLPTAPRIQPWLSGGGALALRAAAAGMILEPAAHAAPPVPPSDSELLVISAGTRAALAERIEAVRTQMASASLHTIARQLAREPLQAHRGAVVAASAKQAADALDALLPKIRNGGAQRIRSRSGAQYADAGTARRDGKIAFLFPGQGSYYPYMHAELVPHFPRLRQWLEDLDRISMRFDDRLARHLFPAAGELDEAQRRLLVPEIGGQAGIACSLALFEQLREGGLVPDAVLGYSNGENAALAAAGVLNVEDREQFLSLLGMMREQGEQADAAGRIPKGASYAVSGIAIEDLCALDEVRAGVVHLAMDNCPNQRVLFGSGDVMQRVAAEIAARGGMAIRLPLDRGYHTPLFARKAQHIRELYDTMDFRAPSTPIYSALTASPMPPDANSIRDIAARQWVGTVRFRETIERLYDDGVRIFLEIGAGARLTGFVTDTLRGRDVLALAIDVEGRSALASLQQFLAELVLAGRIDRVDAFLPCRCVRCAAPPAPRARPAIDSRFAQHHFTLMREFLDREAASTDVVFRMLRGDRGSRTRTLSLATEPWLAEHALGRSAQEVLGGHSLAVVPMTVSLELLADAATRVAGGVAVRIERVRAYRWLALDEETVTLRTDAERQSDGRVRVAIHNLSAAGTPLCVEGIVTVASAYAGALMGADEDVRPPLASVSHDARAFYDLLFHGPALQSIRRVTALSGERIACEAKMPEPPADFATPAMLLDASGQLAGYWLLETERALCNIFPYEIDAIVFNAPPPPSGRALKIRAAVDAGAAVVTTSTDFLDGDRVIARIERMRMRRHTAPPRLAELFAGKRDALTDAAPSSDPALEIATVHDVPIAFLISAEEIWTRTLAQLYLSREERRTWRQLASAVRRAEWLLGRIAAKDAIRRRAAHELGIALDPNEIEIASDALGRPHASPVRGGVTPALSIAHSRDRVVAVATFACASVGIDVELPRERPADFRAGFADDELAGFSQHDLAALWCAKEASAKLLGTGLRGVPREWRVAAYDGRTAAIDFRGRRIEVRIHQRPDHCLAIAKGD